MKTNDLNILYEDNHIIVVIKPQNILSQQDNTNDLDMLTIIKQYLKEKYNKKGNVYLGLVHRLDRPTTGIMVFAKTSKAAKRLSEQLKQGLFQKKYYAIVNGILDKKEGYLENYLYKDSNNNSIIVNEKEGQYAKLYYKVLKEDNNLSLVDITLFTGRHHQIRVQFSNIGHSLYGDYRYGNSKQDRLYLCAYSLSFIHPVTKQELKFENKPTDGLWSKFLK